MAITSPDQHTAIAVNRFGLGARPGEFARVAGRHEPWLLDQLRSSVPVPAVIARLPPSPEVLHEALKRREERRQMRKAGNPDATKGFGAFLGEHYRAQVFARTIAATTTDTPFAERLVHFWSNHFAVSARKQKCRAVAAAIENEAVRPHLNGRFADMLLAVEQHPTMLMYLDNERSVGPNSKAGRRAQKRRPDRRAGLNENLAREILELHTLGVTGGYEQDDVTSFARVITGWTIGRDTTADERRGAAGRFVFHDALHEPGVQRVLGRRYAQRGVEQGEAVLRDLALHPSTARHLATKLARHFVADEPSPALVARLAEVFVKSGGDLGQLHAALVRSPEAWAQPLSKYKSPQDVVISTYRAFDQTPEKRGRVLASYRLLGQMPFEPASPAGWPDTAAGWRGGDALYKRIEWANQVARLTRALVEPAELARNALGPALSVATQTAMRRSQSNAQSLTLFLASPEFQRR